MARGPGGKVREVRHLGTPAPQAPLRRHVESCYTGSGSAAPPVGTKLKSSVLLGKRRF